VRIRVCDAAVAVIQLAHVEDASQVFSHARVEELDAG
jgi:hypothetical protein